MKGDIPFFCFSIHHCMACNIDKHGDEIFFIFNRRRTGNENSKITILIIISSSATGKMKM